MHIPWHFLRFSSRMRIWKCAADVEPVVVAVRPVSKAPTSPATSFITWNFPDKFESSSIVTLTTPPTHSRQAWQSSNRILTEVPSTTYTRYNTISQLEIGRIKILVSNQKINIQLKLYILEYCENRMNFEIYFTESSIDFLRKCK